MGLKRPQPVQVLLEDRSHLAAFGEVTILHENLLTCERPDPD